MMQQGSFPKKSRKTVSRASPSPVFMAHGFVFLDFAASMTMCPPIASTSTPALAMQLKARDVFLINAAYIAQKIRAACVDLLPIVLVIAFFQFAIIRKPLPNMGDILLGTGLVVIGLSMFIEGLEKTLFPLGKGMAHADDAWGLVSVQDIINGVLIPGKRAEEVNVYEIMTKPVLSVPADMDIRYIARLLHRVGLRRAPVEDKGQLIGKVTLSSLVLDCDLFVR
jgi:CBS domain-containing protein